MIGTTQQRPSGQTPVKSFTAKERTAQRIAMAELKKEAALIRDWVSDDYYSADDGWLPLDTATASARLDIVARLMTQVAQLEFAIQTA